MNDYGFSYFNSINNVGSNLPYANPYSNLEYQNLLPNGTYSSGNEKKNNLLVDPYQAFIRGNSFQNLYDKYKNYSPLKLNPTNEREALLYQLLQYKFAITDLNLYLDTNPNDVEMMMILKKYLDVEGQIKEKYEKMYGPLVVDDVQLVGRKWDWISGPWPWEGV